MLIFQMVLVGGLGLATNHQLSRNVSSASDSLTSSFQKIELAPSQKGKGTSTAVEPKSRVIQGGYKIPYNSLIELKTRAYRRPIQTGDVIYQLWFAQVHHLIAGYHARGRFLRTDQRVMGSLRSLNKISLIRETN